MKELCIVKSSDSVSDLEEGKDEANGEVGQPVEAAGHGVGRRSVRLLKELGCDQKRNAGWKDRTKKGPC